MFGARFKRNKKDEQKEFLEHKERVSALRKEEDIWKEKVKVASESWSDLEKRIANNENKCGEQVEKTKLALDALKKEIDNSKAELTQIREDVKSARKKGVELQEKHNTDKVLLDNQIKLLSESREQLEKDLVIKGAKRDEINNEVKELTEKRNELLTEIEALHEESILRKSQHELWEKDMREKTIVLNHRERDLNIFKERLEKKYPESKIIIK